MKKAITFKMGEKEYSLMFNTKALAEMERLNHGRSIMLIMGSMLRNSAAAYSTLNLDFTLAGLKAGLQNMPKFLSCLCGSDPCKQITNCFFRRCIYDNDK